MIILGLGSNIGFPLSNLREALGHLKKEPDIKILGVSSVYISDAELPENAPDTWQTSYLNLAIACQSPLSPADLHLRLLAIETKMGRVRNLRWEPRLIDIDILAWEELSIHQVQNGHELCIPHKALLTRPFALLPLLELIPDWTPPESSLSEISWLQEKNTPTPFNTRKIPHRIDGPALMGIINLTPDSFSDGGKFDKNSSPEELALTLSHLESLVNSGAEIIDIGAESTRPGATRISPEEEWARLKPVLEKINLGNFPIKPKISLDTYHPETVEKVLKEFSPCPIDCPIHWINDVSGEYSQEIAKLLQGTSIHYVTMHNLGVPPKANLTLPKDADPIEILIRWANHKIELLINFGLSPQQIILDLGIGFGLTLSQNWEVLARVKEFKAGLKAGLKAEFPILIGHSRKSFLKPILNFGSNFGLADIQQRDVATCVIGTHLAQEGVDYLRVHNVDMMSQALRTQALLKKLL